MAALLLAAVAVPWPALPEEESVEKKWAERDGWQHPAEVMDALGVKPGSVVADVGCGDGYFTFHLASRVGPGGKVYAEDVDIKVLGKVSARAFKEGVTQIEAVEGVKDDPGLPDGALDAVLVVDAYHEMEKFDAMLAAIYRALKPGGELGIIDRKTEPGQPRTSYLEHHRIPPELVREDAARNGFELLRDAPGFKVPDKSREYFFLIFRKPLAPHELKPQGFRTTGTARLPTRIVGTGFVVPFRPGAVVLRPSQELIPA